MMYLFIYYFMSLKKICELLGAADNHLMGRMWPEGQ